MFRKGTYLQFLMSAIALTLCAATTCQASLVMPAKPEFIAEQFVDAGSKGMGAAEGQTTSEESTLLAEDEWPADNPINPIGLTARKGLGSSGSSSSSSSVPGSSSNSFATVANVNFPDVDDRVQRLVCEEFDPSRSEFVSRLLRPPRDC